MPDRDRHLRLLPPIEAESEAAHEVEPKAKRQPNKAVPPGLFRPQYACRKCNVCERRKEKRAKKDEHCPTPRTQQVWWYRASIRGVRRKVSTGCRDLRSATEVASKWRKVWKRGGTSLERRGPMDIEEATAKFRKFLGTQQGSPDYIDTQMGYLEEVLAAANVRFVDQLDEEVYADWLKQAKEKRLRARGKNVRLYVLKRFGDWLSKKGHLDVNPFALLKPRNEKKDRAHVRRAMWPGECARFLKAVRTRPVETARRIRVNAGLSREAMIKMRREGRVRALVYNTVSQTGLRRKETRLLKIKNVDFTNGVIWLPQEVAKSSEEQYVRLNSDIARRLLAYIRTLQDTDPETPLFPSTRSWDGKRAPTTAVPTIKTFNKDIDAAGLPKKDARDRVLDFHALRMTYVTLLRLAGVPLDMAKRLARHSDIRLTEDIYSDFELLGDAEREAAEMLVKKHRRQRFVPTVDRTTHS